MARKNIGIGSSANDGNGDTLRTAGGKINDNFVEIYRALGGGDSDNLSSQITLEDSAVVFEGATPDDYETRLTAVNATADRQIQLPNASGIVTLNDATQILTAKTLSAPTINSPKMSLIVDSSGNELITFTKAASAINNIAIGNTASGNSPTIDAVGGGTNLNLELAGKGTGSVDIQSKFSLKAVTITADGAASTAASYIICNKGSALAVSLADGTVVGEQKIFSNKGAGVATITPANFAAGTSFAIAQNEAATCIWDGTNWFLCGNQSVTTVA